MLLKCPACGKSFDAVGDSAGSTVGCPYCRTRLRLPSGGAPGARARGPTAARIEKTRRATPPNFIKRVVGGGVVLAVLAVIAVLIVSGQRDARRRAQEAAMEQPADGAVEATDPGAGPSELVEARQPIAEPKRARATTGPAATMPASGKDGAPRSGRQRQVEDTPRAGETGAGVLAFHPSYYHLTDEALATVSAESQGKTIHTFDRFNRLLFETCRGLAGVGTPRPGETQTSFEQRLRRDRAAAEAWVESMKGAYVLIGWERMDASGGAYQALYARPRFAYDGEAEQLRIDLADLGADGRRLILGTSETIPAPVFVHQIVNMPRVRCPLSRADADKVLSRNAAEDGAAGALMIAGLKLQGLRCEAVRRGTRTRTVWYYVQFTLRRIVLLSATHPSRQHADDTVGGEPVKRYDASVAANWGFE